MCEVRSPDMFTDGSSEDGSSNMLSEDDQEQMEVVHFPRLKMINFSKLLWLIDMTQLDQKP